MVFFMFELQIILKCWAQWAVAGGLLVSLTGCQSMGGGRIPASEWRSFTPLAKDKRIMQEVHLRWEMRADVAQICARSIGMGHQQANITPPAACAIWDVTTQDCSRSTRMRMLMEPMP